jgi:hypothetical protein
MNNAAKFEHRSSSSRSTHVGESSKALCDRLSRTRVPSAYTPSESRPAEFSQNTQRLTSSKSIAAMVTTW